jgi:two-component sensor histidine kinase
MPDTENDAPMQQYLGIFDNRIFNASPFGILVFTEDLVMLGCNTKHSENSGVPSRDLRGKHIFDVFPKNPNQEGPDSEEALLASIARVKETRLPDELPIQQHDMIGPDGTFQRRFWRVIHSPIFGGDGELHLYRQDSWDVTASHAAAEEKRLAMRVARGAALIEFWELDVRKGIFRGAPGIAQFIGLPGGQSFGSPDDLLKAVREDDRPGIAAFFENITQDGTGQRGSATFCVITPDGREHHYSIVGERAQGLAGPIVFGAIVDVTQLRRHERELETALAQKDTLLDEVNHRVKNSLQLVSSILSLSAHGEADAAVRQKLAQAAARVAAIAAVHRSLYKGDDVRSVPFGEHLKTFCAEAASSAGTDARGVIIDVDAADVTIATEVAIPLASIVNEFLTNALKYAAWDDDQREKKVEVRLTKKGPALELTVADNGQTEDLQAAPHSMGLGLRLVETLVRQLGGQVEHIVANGWITRLVFPGGLAAL